MGGVRQDLRAGVRDLIRGDRIDAVARMLRHDVGRAAAAPEPFGIAAVEDADVGHAGGLRHVRRATVVGHHQPRAQHDRAQLGQRTAVGHLDVGAPQGVQLGAFARFLLAQHEGVAGVGAQQRLEPVGQPQVVRQAPALEGARSAARNEHHVGAERGVPVRAGQFGEAAARGLFGVQRTMRGQQAQVGQADVLGLVLAMAMGPHHVAEAGVAKAQPDGGQPQQVDEAEAFAAVVQADRDLGPRAQAAGVVQQAAGAQEFVDPGQAAVDVADVVARDNLDLPRGPPGLELVERREGDDLVAQLGLASDVDDDVRHALPLLR